MRAIEKAKTNNAALLKSLEDEIQSADGRRLLAALSEKRLPYNASVDRVIAFGLKRQADEARDVLLGETRKLQAEYFAAIQELVALQKN